MRLKFLTIFGVLGAAVLGSLLISLHGQAEELNRDFGIETLYGDASILDELYLEAVIREGRNQFTSVRLTSDGYETRPTVYDLTNNVGEQVLNNRKLYRGDPWFNPNMKLETDDFIILPVFSQTFMWDRRAEPIVNVSVQEKESENIRRETIVLDEIPRNVQISDPFMIEHNGDIYYVVGIEGHNGGGFIVYSFDPVSMVMNLEFEGSIPNDDASWPRWFATNQGVYVQFEGGNQNDDTGELAIYKIDLDNEGAVLVEDIELQYFWESQRHGENLIYIHDHFDSETSTEISTLHIVNMQTGESHYFPIGEDEASKDSWSNSSSREIIVVGDYLVVNRHATIQENQNSRVAQHQNILIYDLQEMELVYEGHIRLRQDQGLIGNIHWLQLQGFTLQHRD